MTQKNEFEKQPLLDHLRELKKRVIYSLLAFFVASGICYYFAEGIYAFLVQPLTIYFSEFFNTQTKDNPPLFC